MTEESIDQKLWRWKQISDQVSELKAEETRLRMEIFGAMFQEPAEGTNTVDLPKGWKLKATHKINRNIDEAALPSILEELGEGMGDRLVRYKPELNVSEYRKLTDEQRHTLDQALVVKPGTPTLELVPPREEK